MSSSSATHNTSNATAPVHSFVRSVHVGSIAPLGTPSVPSGFVKHAVKGPVAVGKLGLEGDQQADLRVHGGTDKAVYGYAAAHYQLWQAAYPGHAHQFVPGGVGENLAIEGLDETSICVGDVHAIGSALLQVCQPRQPCFKFALRFDNNKLPREMVRNGRSGWYYRVLQEGHIEEGDSITLRSRPNPDFLFSRLVRIVNFGDATKDELIRLSDMEGLARNIRLGARQAL